MIFARSHSRPFWIEIIAMPDLTHLSAAGQAHMVDVSGKAATERVAIAEGSIVMAKATLDLALSGNAKKGDVFAAARIAAIMAAKKTHDLIPLCHPLALTKVSVDLEPDPALPGIRVRAAAKVLGQTGVEMEALTAVAIACLTIYDMLKAVDRSMRIEGIAVLRKSGGEFRRFFARGGFDRMSGDDMLSVAQARARILTDVAKDRPAEAVALERALGRTLARDTRRQADPAPRGGIGDGRLRGARPRPRRAAGQVETDRRKHRRTWFFGFPWPQGNRADFHRRAGAGWLRHDF